MKAGPGQQPRPGQAGTPRSGWAAWLLPLLGQGSAHPGWAFRPHPGWAGGALPPAGLRSPPPTGPLGLHPGWATGSSSQAGASPLRLGRDSLPFGWAAACPGGPSSLAGIYSLGPAYSYCSGWARQGSLAQSGLLPRKAEICTPRPDYIPPRPKFISSGILARPASTPASYASPGTPPDSDWHTLHRRMLVLGRPLAQTSISLLS
jgi:hypothetical protein